MKIRKLFQRAAAFALAAVTALSAVPATTAFAAGDIGTISFTHTYDGAGNAMRYNSSANIGGHTAGGTGEYKYRMYVDGETAFCLQPGVPLKTGNTLAKASSNTWNALSADQKKAVGLALLYGYQGNSGNLSGSDDEKWLATQTLVWCCIISLEQASLSNTVPLSAMTLMLSSYQLAEVVLWDDKASILIDSFVHPDNIIHDSKIEMPNCFILLRFRCSSLGAQINCHHLEYFFIHLSQ